MATCSKGGVDIDDKNKCDCDPAVCKKHCSCPDDCKCGCKKEEKETKEE